MAWAPDYLTDVQAKAFRRINDAVDDDEIADAVSMASRAIDGACHRQFGVVDEAEARTYTGWWNADRRRWFFDIDDLMVTTSLAITLVSDSSTVTVYQLEPLNNVLKGKPWTELTVLADDLGVQPWACDPPELSIMALWGWSAVPAAVRYACKLQMSRFFARRQSPFGIAGSPDQGSELRLLAKLDPDVALGLSEGGFVRMSEPA